MSEGQIVDFSLPVIGRKQRTLKTSIGCVGTGLNTGRRVAMTMKPAAPGHGVRFRRIDLGPGCGDIPARYDMVRDTRFGISIANPQTPELAVSSIEHLMAALAGCGVHNLLVEVDGPELPVLDGSADPFVFLLDCAGTVTQDATRATVRIARPVRVEAGTGFAELAPGIYAREVALSFDFPIPAVGPDTLSVTITPELFRHELARARRFTFAHELAELQSAGLGRGVNLGNTIIIDESGVRNPGGLRMPD